MKHLSLCFLFALFSASVLIASGTSTAVAQTAPSPLYLPIVLTPPSVAPPIIATEDDCDTNPKGEDFQEITSFGYGPYIMYTATFVQARPGTPYRIEWVIDGDRIDELMREGVIAENPEPLISSIIRVSVDPDTDRVIGRCIEPLLRGTYKLEIHLNNTLYRETEIEIR